MPIYAYEAVDNQGRKVKAEIEAASNEDAVNKVHSMGYFPTNVTEKRAAGGDAGGGSAAPAAIMKKKKKGIFIGGVSKKELTRFTQQLSTLQDAGLPIVRSLKILEGQLKAGPLKFTVESVAEEVEGGSSLSEALSKHPKVFDKLYVNMVKAGEAGGVLDTILQRLAMFMEKAQKLKRQVIGASIYPAAVISIATLIVAGIMIFVIPSFEKIFADLGQELPLVTKVLMAISRVVASLWFLVPGIPIFGYVSWKIIGSSKGGRLFLDKVKLHFPLFGMILRKATISRFCRTLGTLITSGVPILEALSIVKNAVGNMVVANAIANVHDSIREGESIAEPLGQSGVFDDIVVNMIDVGEETGELDKMLIKIADNYDDEVDVAVSSMVSLIEPILIIGMGGTVGFIVVALFLPLVSLIKNL